MICDVVEVRALGGHRLHLKFEDGVHGEVDIAEVVRFDGDLAPDVLCAKITGRPLSV